MKVAFLIEHLDSRRGGMERSATEFVTELVALGVVPHVITQTVASDFSLCPVSALGVNGWSRARKFAHFVTAADRIIGSKQWDVVHSVPPCLSCDLYQPRSGLISEALARSVAVRRNALAKFLRRAGALLNSKHQLLLRLERDLLSRESPPLFAALSRYMRRQVQETYQLAGSHVRDVFNGVTVSLPDAAERTTQRQRLRRELNLPENAPTALFVGHNFRRKGLARLLEALAHPATAAWQLLVAGKDAPASYERQAQRLGIQRRVQFLGARQDVPALYLASDAGFLPTYYDPCARTVLEGLSLGLPYVTTAYDGAADCIQNGVHGFVVDSPDRIGGFVEALLSLADPAARKEMSRNALELRNSISMRRHAREIIQIYEEICRTRRVS